KRSLQTRGTEVARAATRGAVGRARRAQLGRAGPDRRGAGRGPRPDGESLERVDGSAPRADAGLRRADAGRARAARGLALLERAAAEGKGRRVLRRLAYRADHAT